MWNKQFLCLCKSCSNPFLQPTSTKQWGSRNNGGLQCGTNSRLTGIHRSRVRRATHCTMPPLVVFLGWIYILNRCVKFHFIDFYCSPGLADFPPNFQLTDVNSNGQWVFWRKLIIFLPMCPGFSWFVLIVNLLWVGICNKLCVLIVKVIKIH